MFRGSERDNNICRITTEPDDDCARPVPAQKGAVYMSVKKMNSTSSVETVEGSAEMRNLLGSKGANLAEIASLGIRVPAGSQSQPRSASSTTTETSGLGT